MFPFEFESFFVGEWCPDYHSVGGQIDCSEFVETVDQKNDTSANDCNLFGGSC